jgi:hypothetical protein
LLWAVPVMKRAPVALLSRGPMPRPCISGSTTTRLSRHAMRDSAWLRPFSFTPGCGRTAMKPTGCAPQRATAQHAAPPIVPSR